MKLFYSPIKTKKIGAALIAVASVVIVSYFIWDNQRVEKSKHIFYIKTNCTHVDSVWNYLLEDIGNDPILFSQSLVNKVEELNRKELADSTNKLIGYMINYQEKNPDPGFLVNFYMMQKKLAYLHDDIEQYRYWDTKRLQFEPFASVNNKLSNAIITWAFLFERDQYDSCNNLLERALALSKAQNDTFYRAAIYINLGASYYEAKLFNRASNCYYEALLSPNLTATHRKILVPNLMAFLNHEKKYAETLRFYERYKNNFDFDNLQEDLGELMSLILCYAHIENNSPKSQYMAYLAAAEDNGILADNDDLYLRIKFSQLKHENHIDSCAALYVKSASVFYENLSYKIESHYENLILLMQNGYQVYDLARLKQEYKNLGASNVYATYFYAKLFANHYTHLNQWEQAKQWQNEAAKHYARNQDRLLMLSKSNVELAIDNAKIQLEIRRKKFQIAYNNLRNRQLLTICIALLIIGIFLIILFWLTKSNQEKKIEILRIQNSISEKNIEIEQKNNEKRKGAVFKSKALYQKLEGIVETLNNWEQEPHPALEDCKQEIERLLHTKEIVSIRPTLEPRNIYTQYLFLRTQYTCLSDLNETSYKILVHSILETDPKDISHLLNLNVQYVRNVRSNLKKAISKERLEPWIWSDLTNS